MKPRLSLKVTHIISRTTLLPKKKTPASASAAGGRSGARRERASSPDRSRLFNVPAPVSTDLTFLKRAAGESA
jgi:hypothetical protein